MRLARRAVLSAVVIGLLWAGAATAGTMSVTVKQGRVLEAPMVFGRLVGHLPYGARVSVLGRHGAFYQVRSGSLAGWMHRSALTTKRIVLTGGRVRSGVSGSELALAGKGFNQQVENRYRASGRADYTWVDKMEHSNNFDGPTLAAFARQGGLRGGGL